MTMPSEPVPKSNTMPRPSRRPPELVKEILEPDPSPQISPSLNPTTTIAKTTSPTTTTAPTPRDLSYIAGVMGAFNALALVLSARLIVLVAVAGAIGLTYLALERPDQWNTLAGLGAYLLGFVVPAVWLASRGK